MSTEDPSDEYARLSAERERIFREIAPAGPRPLVTLASRTAMFAPLAVIIAILPGLYGLANWDLTPPGPWWGLRGFAATDSNLWLDQSPMADTISGSTEAEALRWVTMSPPLYAWLEAVTASFSPSRSPVTTVLPAYFAGILLVYLVYLHGKTWVSPGAALFGTFIFGLTQTATSAMQRAGPATLTSLMFVASLEFYSRHILAGERGRIRGRILYAMGCGACIGLCLMSVGLIGLAILPIIGMHQLALNVGETPVERARHWYEAWRLVPGLFYGLVAVSVALVIAAPWHVWMTLVHQSYFWLAQVEPTRPLGHSNRGPFGQLVETTPVFLVLALFIALRTIRRNVQDSASLSIDDSYLTKPVWLSERIAVENEKTRNGLLLWSIWALLMLALSVYWPLGPQNTLGLLITAPLSLLAGHAVRELNQRNISARILVWVTPLTFFCLVWKLSPSFRRYVRQIQETLPGRFEINPALAAVLSVALFMLVLWLSGRILARWAAVRDRRSRLLLAANLGIFVVIHTILGIQEISSRHEITSQLLDLRQAIVKSNSRQTIERLYVVGAISPVSLSRMPLEQATPKRAPSASLAQIPIGIDPAGRLRFILQTALPAVNQDDLPTLDLLRQQKPAQRLVILIGPDTRISSAMLLEFGLEEIHPGVPDIFQAFASSPGLFAPLSSTNRRLPVSAASSLNVQKNAGRPTNSPSFKLIRQQ